MARATSSVLPLDQKPGEYFVHARSNLVEALPRPIGRVIDVGCGAGEVGAELRRQASPTWMTGVEYEPAAAERARSVFDEMLVGDAAELLAAHAPAEPYDTVLCFDVLEHLYDPPAILGRLAEMTRPGGTLSVSLPNARHWMLLRDLAVRGTFAYELHGHRDSTHIRWFTRKDLVTMIEETGWAVQSVSSPPDRPRRWRWAATLTRGASVHFDALQWYVVARRR